MNDHQLKLFVFVEALNLHVDFMAASPCIATPLSPTPKQQEHVANGTFAILNVLLNYSTLVRVGSRK